MLKNFDFDPDPAELAVGDTITWTNEDDILHGHVRDRTGAGRARRQQEQGAKPDGLFDQEMDGPGSTFEFTFEKAGTYGYYCAIHPGMTGKVIVR